VVLLAAEPVPFAYGSRFAQNQMSASPSAPEKIDSVTFDRLLAQQDPVETGLFDLRATGFIAPSGLVNLGLAIEASTKVNTEVQLLLRDDSLCTYLARSGFLIALPPACRIEPEVADLYHAYDHRIGRSPMLIEVTRLYDRDALDVLLDRTIDTVAHVRHRRNDALDVAALLSELGGNLLEHGGGSGLLALQVYREGSDSFLELAIGDLGPGIRASLQRNPQIGRLAGDLQAIQHAVRPMISGSTEPARGSGLYQLLRLTREHGGSVQIRSGAAKARWRADRPHGFGFDTPFLAGTQISFTLPGG